MYVCVCVIELAVEFCHQKITQGGVGVVCGGFSVPVWPPGLTCLALPQCRESLGWTTVDINTHTHT